MLKRTMTTAMIGGKVLALGALMMGSTALAQTGEVVEGNTTVVETPDGNTAVVPGVAAEPGAPVGAVTPPDYPLLEQLDNDEAIAESLIGQGFTDVHILREGPILTVNAQRAGQPTELVYSIANGSLISVDGVELREAPERSSGQDSDTMSTPDDGTDDGDTGTDDGSGDGTDNGGDTGTDDGSDDGGDPGGDDGSDGSDGADGSDGSDGSDGGDGSDGSDGSDGGSDGSDGSDGGSDGGGEGGDGGENNG